MLTKLLPKGALWLFLISLSSFLNAQDTNKEGWFYATVKAEDAQDLQRLNPGSVIIYSTVNGVSAVKITEAAGHYLHDKVITHGPGYVYMSSLEEAVQSIQEITLLRNARVAKTAIAYTIDQDVYVNQALNLVDNLRIETTIKKLVSYGTRYHTLSAAKQSVTDIKATWESMAAGRSDISVRLVNHTSSVMPSAVMTIRGTTYPDEYVIIGGHIDSINPSNNNNAPGADDDASGIATITETARVLIAMGYKPAKTIEIMAYAAEEVGLRGSNEIAKDYKARNVNVVAVAQFDMTNYKGSSKDIYFIEDEYTTPLLNTYLKQLLDHYNVADGPHKLTYGSATCNYGCSDHASWKAQGYNASFPFEAADGEDCPYIHTANDTYANSPVAQALHAAKFSKVALEFLIEVAKTGNSQPGCGIPTGSSTSGITSTTATISWGAVSQATSYQINYRTSGGSWIIGTSTSNSKALTGLTPNTNYEFQVKAICPDTSSAFSPIATFKTSESNPVTYCIASGTDATAEWIANVTFGSFSNTSPSNGGYGNFTAKTISLSPGQTYSVSLKPGFSSSNYTEYWKVWIDLNKDGDFTDAGEQVFDGRTTGTSALTGNLTVPSTASSISTRMRVAMKYSSTPSSCGSFKYGEVEDYTVNISPAQLSSLEKDVKGIEFHLFPNPVESDIITVAVTEGFSENATVKVMSAEGNILTTTTIKEATSKMDISRLQKGHSYIVLIESGGHSWTGNFIKR